MNVLVSTAWSGSEPQRLRSDHLRHHHQAVRRASPVAPCSAGDCLVGNLFLETWATPCLTRRSAMWAASSHWSGHGLLAAHSRVCCAGSDRHRAAQPVIVNGCCAAWSERHQIWLTLACALTRHQAMACRPATPHRHRDRERLPCHARQQQRCFIASGRQVVQEYRNLPVPERYQLIRREETGHASVDDAGPSHPGAGETGIKRHWPGQASAQSFRVLGV